jgi:glycosyltransferase involved in cell wall biosynthesis
MQDFGGAGTAAYRIHQALCNYGINSSFYVLEKWRNDPSVHLLADDSDKIFRTIQSSGLTIQKNSDWGEKQKQWRQVKQAHPNHSPNLEIFTDPEGVAKLDSPQLEEAIKKADIIQLHWVAGVINFVSIPDIIKQKPLVWRFSDLNPFTGGCHYSWGCDRYIKSCGACPLLASTREKDVSRLYWLQKMAAYQTLNITCVAPSKWIAHKARKSSLLGCRPIKTITNCLPLDKYKPRPQKQSRHELGLPEEGFIILFGATSITNIRKGLWYILQSLYRLKHKTDKQIVLVSFGKTADHIKNETGYPWFSLPFLDNDKALSMAYSIADVFILPSLEENQPSVALESLASGVPVVGFAAGGIAEVVGHRKVGYLAKPGDSKGLADGILWVMSQNTNGSNIKTNCRIWAEKYFSEKRCAKEYSQLYQETLSAMKPVEKDHHQAKNDF